MTSLVHESFMTFCEAPKEKRNDASFVHDALKRTIFQLNKSKMQLEEAIACDAELAILAYTTSRTQSALEALQRVHKNRVFKDYISVALFQLVALRLQMEQQGSRRRSQRSAVKEVNGTIYKILRRLDSCKIAPPSDAVLFQKLARQVDQAESEAWTLPRPRI